MLPRLAQHALRAWSTSSAIPAAGAATPLRHLWLNRGAPQQTEPSVLRRFTGRVTGITFAAGVALTVGSLYAAEELKLVFLIPTRLVRDVWCAVSIIADYTFSIHDGLQGEEREQALNACHQRGADRLLQLCFANGGVYTKLGQHVGQLDHLLPDQYVHTMRNNLLDRCPVSRYSEVRNIITRDLGAPPEELFKHFNPNPIASASLAQVHVAEDKDGNKLAVKVQHAGLRDSAAADIATVSGLVNLVKLVFPDYDYTWLVNEIKYNLPRELDFTHEARNAERCRENLNSKHSIVKGRVHIPQIRHDLTSARVLTMEFVDGVQVTDLYGLHKLKVSTGKLSRLISEAFSEMIFFHGFVHADPHAANMLVRKKHGKMQLVLLDHGLYREIDDKFRMEYAELWKGLVFGDVARIEKCAKNMNAGDMVPLFAGMLTQRPWDDVLDANNPNHLQVRHTPEHKAELQGYASQYRTEVAQLLLRIPRELLLLLKTNDCLRSVDNCLGQPVNNIVVTARECTRALNEHKLAAATSLPGKITAHWQGQLEMLRVETVLSVLQVLSWGSWLLQLVGLERGDAADDDRGSVTSV